MDLTIGEVLQKVLLLILGSSGTFAVSYYWTKRREGMDKAEKREQTKSDEREQTNQRIIELEKQLATLGAAVVPISTAFQAILIKELTHFHTPVMDALLVKLGPPYMLTPVEEVELVAALKERAVSMDGLIDEWEREAAEILPAVMRRARREAVEVNRPVEVQLVALPEASEGKPLVPEIEAPKE